MPQPQGNGGLMTNIVVHAVIGADGKVHDAAIENSDRADLNDEALKIARDIGFPLMIKAAFGGGGRGMRVVNKAADLARLLDEARAEAGSAFGNPAVFLEKYIPRAKHIEVQVLGDQHRREHVAADSAAIG